MASVEGLKRRLEEWKPFVQSAFIVFISPQPSPIDQDQLDDDFEIVVITSPNDPLLPKITTSKRQLREAKKALGEGRWDIIVALKDGEPVGRIWETIRDEKPLANGVPRVKLADDEFMMFDLFVEREYRRSGVANNMAHAFFTKYDPEKTHMKYGYGFIAYENAPSILWHHSVGFQIVQTINYLSIGPFIKWKIPFSDVPRFGPFSQKGRHTDAETDLFGLPLFP